MLFIHLLVAVLVALLLGGVLAGVFRRRYTLNIWLAVLMVTFLAAWAGGIWVMPIVGGAWGGNWVAALAAGLVIALLLAAILPSEKPKRKSGLEKSEGKEPMLEPDPVEVAWAFGGIFWLLITVLILVILLRYAA